MRELKIAADETGVVRLFEIQLPEYEIAQFIQVGTPEDGGVPDWPLRDAMGVQRLDPAKVEVFPAGDVSAVGLEAYLIEGLGMDEAEVARDRAKLASLRGYVAVVSSGAFGDEEQVVRPRSPLSLIGTYHEPEIQPVIGTIETPSAEPTPPRDRRAKRTTYVKHANSSPIKTLIIVVMAILLGAGIVLVLALGLG